MLEAIALLAPPLVALRFYNHLHRHKLSVKMLVMSYGVFVLLINLCIYLVTLYVLGSTKLVIDDMTFVNYSIAALLLAFVFPFVVSLFETTLTIDVKRNARKK